MGPFRLRQAEKSLTRQYFADPEAFQIVLRLTSYHLDGLKLGSFIPFFSVSFFSSHSVFFLVEGRELKLNLVPSKSNFAFKARLRQKYALLFRVEVLSN